MMKFKKWLFTYPEVYFFFLRLPSISFLYYTQLKSERVLVNVLASHFFNEVNATNLS